MTQVQTAGEAVRHSRGAAAAHESSLIRALYALCQVSSKKALASKIGISQQYLDDIINRRRGISDKTLGKILKADL